MKIIVHTVKDCAEKISATYSPVEWLTVNKALKMMAENSDVPMSDRNLARKMFSTKPEFCEMGGNGMEMTNREAAKRIQRLLDVANRFRTACNEKDRVALQVAIRVLLSVEQMEDDGK